MDYHDLPKDMKYEIVKNLSFYRTLNKELYQDKAAYEKFCQLPISINELKDYTTNVYMFTPLKNGLNIIRINDNYVYVYTLTTLNLVKRLNVSFNRIPYERFNPSLYINKDTYYDMITTYYILSDRDCDEKLNIQYIMKNIIQFKNDVVTDDMDKYLYNIEKYFYHKASTSNTITLTDFTKNINKQYDLKFEEMEKDLMQQLKYL